MTDRHRDDTEGGGDYDEFLKRVGINLCGSTKKNVRDEN